MARASSGPQTRRRRNKCLSQAKGFRGARRNLYRPARLQVMHGLISAYRERKRKKRTYRALWITRISAALEPLDMSYSRFIYGMRKAGFDLDRSVVSEMAVTAPEDFARLVEAANAALAVEPSAS
ncbi:MAG TPA: 50S ribosomal protein L20 [candidate division WOR-3 bacterium]|uniref:Large ribosomal subunit protein bL20 n=1 Tax=candidate division WOR-3 bacterium TaxID=2052148 RepID=A0A7V0XF06_UNCW3|nr:50S ribosomal protein L20 [candidate division WOR-3 bacterium]